MKKLITAEEAAGLIENNMSLAVGGFGAYGAAETLLQALADRYEKDKEPKNLLISTGISPGDNSRNKLGLNRIARPGLIGNIIASHFGNAPLISDMVTANQIGAYALPLGVVFHLYDAIAGKKPGVLTKVGLETYADPEIEGCMVNEKAKRQGRKIVERITLNSEPCLVYLPFSINACFIRACCADEDGNLSVEDSAVGDCSFDMTAATHNSGGIVIAEVKEIRPAGSLDPRKVRIHSSLVDYVVLSEKNMYRQGYAAEYRPELCGEKRIPADGLRSLPMNERKIISRRASLELSGDGLVNLGIGIPSGVGSVANEEGIPASLSLESGPQGGIPVEGLGFGASVNPDAIYNMSDVFHLYDGGVLDMSFLGAAEIDQFGNINVSRFGDRCTGPGGFINISQNAKKVCFLSTFTSGGLETEFRDGRLHVVYEGKVKKFCKHVQQITFSAEYARKSRQKILYITERAVFELGAKGLVLVEIAPGIDLQRDVLSQMDFVPEISANLHEMDHRIFSETLMRV